MKCGWDAEPRGPDSRGLVRWPEGGKRAKIAGKKGERVVYVKSLVGQMSAPQRDVEEYAR